MGRKQIACWLWVGVAGPALAGASAQVTADIIMATGPAPGLAPNVFAGPSAGSINANGDIVFEAGLSGPGVTNDNYQTVWLHQDATGPVLMARTGRPAAGFDFFTTYEDFYRVSIDDLGGVAISGAIEGPGIDPTNNTAYWYGTPAQLDLIANHGAPIPGTDPTIVFDRLTQDIRHGASGHLAIPHSHRPAGPISPSEFILLAGMHDALTPYWSSDGQGVDTGITFEGIGEVLVNRHGQFAHAGLTADGGWAFYTDTSGTLTHLVDQDGQQAPGLQTGVTLQSAQLDQFHDGGSIGFYADLAGPGVHTNSDRTYWVASSGDAPELMIREWEFLTHRNGTDRLRILGRAAHNDNGNVAFFGRLQITDDGRHDDAVWFGTPGNYQIALQEGDTDPAIPGMAAMGFHSSPVLNDRDLLVVRSEIREVDGTDPIGNALWAYRDGITHLVAATGSVFDLAAPGEAPDLRVVGGLSTLNRSIDDGQTHTLNDADQLAVLLFFTDDTTALVRYDLTGLFALGDPGDLTGDGFVGVEDLDLLLANWGNATFAGSWRDGDADGDGVVGQGDLDVIIANWSAGTPPGGVIPEPASGALLLVVFGLVTRRRRA